MICQNTRNNQYCDDVDNKLVQLRSREEGPTGRIGYTGVKIMMCKECRKDNLGTFKILKAKPEPATV